MKMSNNFKYYFVGLFSLLQVMCLTQKLKEGDFDQTNRMLGTGCVSDNDCASGQKCLLTIDGLMCTYTGCLASGCPSGSECYQDQTVDYCVLPKQPCVLINEAQWVPIPNDLDMDKEKEEWYCQYGPAVGLVNSVTCLSSGEQSGTVLSVEIREDGEGIPLEGTYQLKPEVEYKDATVAVVLYLVTDYDQEKAEYIYTLFLGTTGEVQFQRTEAALSLSIQNLQLTEFALTTTSLDPFDKSGIQQTFPENPCYVYYGSAAINNAETVGREENVFCTTDTDCLIAPGNFKRCDTDFRICEECSGNTDCKDNPNGKICNFYAGPRADYGFCAECWKNSDCGCQGEDNCVPQLFNCLKGSCVELN